MSCHDRTDNTCIYMNVCVRVHRQGCVRMVGWSFAKNKGPDTIANGRAGDDDGLVMMLLRI